MSWSGREAWTPLPLVFDPATPVAKLTDEDNDRNFAEFFNGCSENSRIIILIRGIDGLSIDLGGRLLLQASYPRHKVTIAFSVAPDFVDGRLLENQIFFRRTEPYNNRL